MNTNRFETFFDAILAIIITVLVLKLEQPISPTFDAFFSLNARFIIYAVCFLVIVVIWYDNHNLFQVVEEIDNRVLGIYAMEIFAISLLPYFASWVALNINSIAAETMFGIDYLAVSILYMLSIYEVFRANPYTCGLTEASFKSVYKYIPILINVTGFIVSYTIYTPGIFISVLISLVIWLFFARFQRPDGGSTDRFEAFVDAIIAIIITIIVLEIPMVSGGSWSAFLDIKMEFIVYAISFIVCFNFWNYHNNLFHLVNKINPKVIWFIVLALFFLSLIPYLTIFVAMNSGSFVPNFLYGLNFILIGIASLISDKALKDSDKANIALQLELGGYNLHIISISMVIVGMILGYFIHPLAIVIACFVSIIAAWIIDYARNNI